MDKHDEAIRLKYPFLAGDGEAARLARATDWAATPVGPIDTWPAGLRALVGTLLGSRQPMFLWWGPELVQFYNDAYIPSFGQGKHPAAMGQRGRDCWPEIWSIIGPQIDDVMAHGTPTWQQNQLVPIFRNGRIEDVYWTYGYSPARLEDGRIGGTLVVCTETTQDMLAQRRQGVLRLLADALAALAPSDSGFVDNALQALPALGADVPCLGLLVWDEPGQPPRVSGAEASLCGRMGALLASDAAVVDALARGEVAALRGVLAWDAGLPEPVVDVAFAPLPRPGGAGLMALGVGLNPRVPLDDAYRLFLRQLADQFASWLAGAEGGRVRQQATSERELLMQRAPVAMAMLQGPEHVFTLANPAYCRLVGRREQALLGRSYRQALPELVHTEITAHLRTAYDEDRTYISPETVVRMDVNGDGRLVDRWVKFTLEPMHALAGQVNGLMVVAIDVTDQVLARQTLERSHAERQHLLERTQAAARAKDEFLAMLGHELRNPLAPIVSALHVMEARGVGAARERAVIERQVKHMTRLVDDLLDVARIARGRIRLEPTLTRAAVLLQRAAEMAQPLMDQRGHRFEVSLPPAPVLWWGDSDRLVQVISNLLTNAARYTPPGGHVRLSGRRDGQTLVIEVADDGTGIDAELLPGIFDVFYQGHRQGADRSQGGLGLGLALVKNLVALHDGQVQAHSAGPGQGSRFVVRLPLREQPAAMPADWPSGRQAALQSRRVLLVDDNRDAADLLAEALALHGHEVRVAYTPQDALAVAEKFHPQVAVLDVGLPQMDGHALARQLRLRAGEQCALVALSGYGQDSDRDRAQAAGFARYLVKPVTPARLQALIGELGAA